VQLILLTFYLILIDWSCCLCEAVRVTHDDGVELTFDKVVNDSSLYVLNQIESNRKNLFVSENRIESNWNIFF